MKDNTRDSPYKVRTFNTLRGDPEMAIVLITAIIFAGIYSLFSILKYLSLDASGWDLGIHSQALWSTLNGGFFYSNLIGQSLLAEHFAPFEFLQLPVYAIYPSPISILVLQAVFLSFGSVPLFLIARHVVAEHFALQKVNRIFSFLIVFSYLLSPFTLSMISFDFHNIAFLPLFFFLAIYGFLKERKLLSLFSLGMIISLHSNFIFIVGVILLYEFLFLRTKQGKGVKTWLSTKGDARSLRNSSYFAIAILLLYTYLVMSTALKGYIGESDSISMAASTGATGTPFTSIPGLVQILFSHPLHLLSAITANGGAKATFLLILFGSLLFLPLTSPLSLIMSVPYMLYALPSSYGSYYELGEQYTGMVLGAVYLSAIFGYSNLLRLSQDFQRKHPNKKGLQKVRSSGFWGIALAIFIAMILVIPLGTFSPPQVFERPSGSQMVNLFELNYNTNGSSFLFNSEKQIPQGDYILIQNNLMPFFSNYPNAYSTPWSPGISSNITNFQYIVYQNGSFWAQQPSDAGSIQNIAVHFLQNGTFVIYKSDTSLDLFILKRS